MYSTSIPFRSAFVSQGFKRSVNTPALSRPQEKFIPQLYTLEHRIKMSSNSNIVTSANSGFPNTSDTPGEQFEPRQTATSEDYEPNPSKSIKLSPARQRLVDDVCFLTSRNTRNSVNTNWSSRSSRYTAASLQWSA